MTTTQLGLLTRDHAVTLPAVQGPAIRWATPEEMARVRVSSPLTRDQVAANLRQLRDQGLSDGTLSDLAAI